MEQVLFSPAEAAEKLGLSRSTVYVLIREGRLQSVRIGRSRRVPAAALDGFVAALLDEDHR